MFKLVKCLEVIHILKLFVTLLAVVVAQLTEQSLSTQEDRGLNPVNTSLFLGSGCGTIDRAVAYNTRGPGFESSHR